MDVSFEDLLSQLNAAPTAVPVPLESPSLLDLPLSASRFGNAPSSRGRREVQSSLERGGVVTELSPGVFEYYRPYGAYPLWRDEWTSNKPGDICVKFEAKAPSDVALCFSPQKGSADGIVFEIVIGGWKNTKSVIRTKAQGTERAVSTMPRTCAMEYRHYWATLRDGVVACGFGETPGANVIVAWKDPSYNIEFASAQPCWVSFTSWDSTMLLCSVQVSTNDEFTGLLDVEMSEYTPAYVLALEEERRKNIERAQKFGVEIVEPDLHRILPTLSFADQEMARPRVTHVQGFVTGFDTESEAEKAKRLVRKARFGLPDEETPEPDPMMDPAAKQARAERFGVPLQDALVVTSMLARTTAPRRDPAAQDQTANATRLDTLHLFGDLSHTFTAEVMGFFEGYGPKRTEWLDDASVNIVFEDQYTAARALQHLTKDLPDSPELDPLSAQGWKLAMIKNHSSEFVPVLLRNALVTDVKSNVDEHRTIRKGRRRPVLGERPEPEESGRAKRSRRSGGGSDDDPGEDDGENESADGDARRVSTSRFRDDEEEGDEESRVVLGAALVRGGDDDDDEDL